MKLSIVTTLYSSSSYIDEYYERISKEARKITKNYEIIFVNDGSPDDSVTKAIDFSKKDKKVKIIDLSRNFGHHEAIITGLKYATGDFIFLIDCDLEEAPELLSEFYTEFLREPDFDIIIGQQKKRKGGIFERITGHLFYTFINLVSTYSIPESQLIARLMTKRFVKSLVSHHEKELFFAGICSITGYNQKFYKTLKHHKGDTAYSFSKKLSQTVNAIVSFSNKPLYFIFILGVCSSCLAFLYILYIIILKIFFTIQLGFSSIIASIWAVGGVLLISVGILGIYIAKIFSEVKNRPIIIKQVYNLDLNLDDDFS